MRFYMKLVAFALLTLITSCDIWAVTPLASWQGNSTPWEAGTETLADENRVVPIVNVISEQNSNIECYYLNVFGGNNEEFIEIPENFNYPPVDAGLTGVIDNNGVPWVEHWPIDQHNFAPVEGISNARWFIDYRGIRNFGERKQWIITEQDELDTTRLVQVSYGDVETIISFEGYVSSEPFVYEARGSNVVNDVYLYPVWANESQDGFTIFNRVDNEIGHLGLTDSSPHTSVCMSFVPDQHLEELGSVYFIERVNTYNYKLIHYVNGEYYERMSFNSAHVPEKLISPFYQPNGTYSPDFLTWLACDGTSNYIHWARITYSDNFLNPEVKHDSVRVDSQITQLRAHYLWDHDDVGNFDSWYITYSVYDNDDDTSELYFHPAGRYPDDPNSNWEIEPAIPQVITVSKAYPNPFNASTRLSFDLTETGHIFAGVYNLVGQRVHTLSDRQFQPGTHILTLNNPKLPSGTYFIQISRNTSIQSTQRITLVK